MLNTNQTIDLGLLKRSSGEVGRLVIEISTNGGFTLSHMLTPDEGTILASGAFKENIKGLPQLAVTQLVQNSLKGQQTKQPAHKTNPILEILEL